MMMQNQTDTNTSYTQLYYLYSATVQAGRSKNMATSTGRTLTKSKTFNTMIKIIHVSLFSLYFLPAICWSQSNDLYNTISKLDSVFFTAYNTCDMDKQAEFYSDSIEFYHDKGGLSTSKKEILESIKKNICGKVTRELVKGSVEVYPIPNFGAIELGLHRFHNKQEPNAVPHDSKFIIIWHEKNGKWEISRVISLH
jgi:hypothetical protein